jgi:hypothetical protein
VMSTRCNCTCRGNVPKVLRGPCSKTSCPPPQCLYKDLLSAEGAKGLLRRSMSSQRSACCRVGATTSAKASCPVNVFTKICPSAKGARSQMHKPVDVFAEALHTATSATQVHKARMRAVRVVPCCAVCCMSCVLSCVSCLHI